VGLTSSLTVSVIAICRRVPTPERKEQPPPFSPVRAPLAQGRLSSQTLELPFKPHFGPSTSSPPRTTFPYVLLHPNPSPPSTTSQGAPDGALRRVCSGRPPLRDQRVRRRPLHGRRRSVPRAEGRVSGRATAGHVCGPTRVPAMHASVGGTRRTGRQPRRDTGRVRPQEPAAAAAPPGAARPAPPRGDSAAEPIPIPDAFPPPGLGRTRRTQVPYPTGASRPGRSLPPTGIRTVQAAGRGCC
jgi:hypothetical protein